MDSQNKSTFLRISYTNPASLKIGYADFFRIMQRQHNSGIFSEHQLISARQLARDFYCQLSPSPSPSPSSSLSFWQPCKSRFNLATLHRLYWFAVMVAATTANVLSKLSCWILPFIILDHCKEKLAQKILKLRKELKLGKDLKIKKQQNWKKHLTFELRYFFSSFKQVRIDFSFVTRMSIKDQFNLTTSLVKRGSVYFET